jgi:hypothetical protein
MNEIDSEYQAHNIFLEYIYQLFFVSNIFS